MRVTSTRFEHLSICVCICMSLSQSNPLPLNPSLPSFSAGASLSLKFSAFSSPNRRMNFDPTLRLIDNQYASLEVSSFL
ncbi:unnamed protein product [Citrullus colocynthis]|uniref:Uncharacterized protein n=1 Tax=Citrullus colocynthis TaxID=252529 RepID=A0ABP0XRW9_9ROSI